MTIKPHNTAIKRNKMSAPTKWAKDQGIIQKKVYDWGCGCGDDAKFLRECDFNVIAYDPFHFPEYEPETINFGEIDTVLNNYVLNVIENKEDRSKLLKNILDKISDNTTVILSVRRSTEINKNGKAKGWKKHKDGWITSSDTFQKGYSKEEITKLCSHYFEIMKTKSISGGIILVLKKKGKFIMPDFYETGTGWITSEGKLIGCESFHHKKVLWDNIKCQEVNDLCERLKK